MADQPNFDSNNSNDLVIALLRILQAQRADPLARHDREYCDGLDAVTGTHAEDLLSSLCNYADALANREDQSMEQFRRLDDLVKASSHRECSQRLRFLAKYLRNASKSWKGPSGHRPKHSHLL